MDEMIPQHAPSAHDDVVLRIAGPADLAAVVAFLPALADSNFHDRFPGRTLRDFYRWKYLENPFGEAVVGVAMAGDRAVGTIAAVPKRLQVGAEILMAYELGDFLADRDWMKSSVRRRRAGAPLSRMGARTTILLPSGNFRKRRGLSSRLVEMVCSEAARRGAALAYGRPNDNAFAILSHHLGFGEPLQLQMRRHLVVGRVLADRYGLPMRLVRLSGMDRLSQLAVGGFPMRQFVVERVPRFGQDVDELWERVRGDYAFVIVRDSKYLNWRFADSPTPYRTWIVRQKGVVSGFIVAFVSQTYAAGYIMDLFTERSDRAAARCLLRACFRNLLGEGVRRIYTWTSMKQSGSESDRALRRACMLRTGPPLHFAVRFLNASASAVRISSQGSHFSLGDFDGT